MSQFKPLRKDMRLVLPRASSLKLKRLSGQARPLRNCLSDEEAPEHVEQRRERDPRQTRSDVHEFVTANEARSPFERQSPFQR